LAPAWALTVARPGSPSAAAAVWMLIGCYEREGCVDGILVRGITADADALARRSSIISRRVKVF